ncbi:MAG: ribonuclease H-like domain-containing protein, partial [Candidatus Woesearchaeota archaeon]|nr:ribonuclease H-like domain-containing protein [Candidatus Woesearchaeota archaeon]
MAKIQFYPLDATYRVKDNKAYILLFGRAVDGKTICVVDDSFAPYFWVILKKEADIPKFRKSVEGLVKSEKDEILKITATEIARKNYLGDDVDAVKIILNQPKAVNHFRDVLKERKEVKLVLEATIPFARRYFIDKNIVPTALYEVMGKETNERVKTDYVIKAENIRQVSDDTLKPRILAFDIETYNPVGKNVDPEKHPIIMVSLYGEGIKKVITWKTFKTTHNYIEFVKSEAELINAFKDAIDKYKPDIIAGYFSDGFDFPYIKQRAEKYKISFDIGWDYSVASLTKGKNPAFSITGIMHIDVFRFIRFIMGGSMETDYFDLSSVAEEILGEKKIEANLDLLARHWDNSSEELNKYCEYNLHDSVLAFKLCEKIIPNIIELVKIVSLPIFDVGRMSVSQLVEWYLIKHTPEYN